MLFLPAFCLAAACIPALSFPASAASPVPLDEPTKPASTAAAQDAAWTAAHDLKRKSDFEKAAPAFAAYAREYPGTPRGIEALVEEGVCWFSLGRARQRLQQNNQDSLQAFGIASARFDAVVREHAASAVAGRAQYMRGTVNLFSGDLQGAEAQYGKAIEDYASDPKYLPKSLERRAAVRRHLLRTAGANADLTRYLREFPKGEDAESARRYLSMMAMFERPAPELNGGTWIQGGPLRLADLQGDVVVIYFFATWCEKCETARPFLLDLQRRYEAMGVRWIGIVDSGKGQTHDSVRAFLAPNDLRFPVYMDGGGTSTAFRGQKIPDVVLLDRLGRVRWHDNPANLQDATIEQLLTEDPHAIPTPR